MKLIKTVPALFAIALLAGCSSQQCCDDTTAAEGSSAATCKAENTKSGCCSGEKTEAAKASCCEASKTEAKPSQKQ